MKPSDSRLLEPDKLVRAVVLADAFGISERAVRMLAEKGVISRTSASLYPLRESIRAYTHHLRETAARRDGTGAGSALTLQRERVAREQADALAMKNAAARGELISAAEVERMWATICRAVRTRMLATPARAHQRLPHLTAHDLRTFDDEIRRGLTELSDDEL